MKSGKLISAPLSLIEGERSLLSVLRAPWRKSRGHIEQTGAEVSCINNPGTFCCFHFYWAGYSQHRGLWGDVKTVAGHRER